MTLIKKAIKADDEILMKCVIGENYGFQSALGNCDSKVIDENCNHEGLDEPPIAFVDRENSHKLQREAQKSDSAIFKEWSPL